MAWLRPMFAPVTFAAITLLGHLLVRTYRGAADLLVLPSLPIALDGLGGLVKLATGLVTYSFFPWTLRNWWDIAAAIVLMSLVLRGRLSHRQYITAFVVGALVGGLAFVVSAPRAVLIGPVMAAYGLVGFFCIAAIRDWRSFHWLAKIYSAIVLGAATFTILSAFVNPPPTRIGEAVAVAASALLGYKVLRNRSSELPDELRSQDNAV